MQTKIYTHNQNGNKCIMLASWLITIYSVIAVMGNEQAESTLGSNS